MFQCCLNYVFGMNSALQNTNSNSFETCIFIHLETYFPFSIWLHEMIDHGVAVHTDAVQQTFQTYRNFHRL